RDSGGARSKRTVAPVIVGGPSTFGKGTVQAVLPLPAELGAMKITTGMFFLPNGQTTQFQGVKADVGVKSLMAGFDTGEADLEYALVPQSVEAFSSKDAAGRWIPVDPSWFTRLQTRSNTRVKGDESFREISEAVEEATRDRETLKVSEIVAKDAEDEDAEAKPKKAETEAEEDAAPSADRDRFERLHEVFTDEGVNVLVDAINVSKARTARK
ncbi:MAG: hypothetical protein HC923_08605, partial [Myxococcales bacterium]|nr:hypothetical protein [Myxococcales bacterium]